MLTIFHILLYKPIFNLLVWLYNVVPGSDLGLVIILLTIIIRLVLYPLTNASIKAQKSMQELQPKLEEINRTHKTDPQKRAQAMMELYKVHKVNPLSSCLPVLVQVPFLIALFLVLRDGIASTDLSTNLYSFIQNPGTLNPISLGFLDLSKPSYVLAVLAGVAQFVQTKMMTRKQQKPPKEAGEGAKDESMTVVMNKQMLYVMPVLTTIFGFQFAAGLTLYWFCSTVLMALQQLLVSRTSKDNPPPAAAGPQEKVIEGQIVQ